MTRKRRLSRPADPAEIARRRAAERIREAGAAEWGLDRGVLALAVNADVETRSDVAGRLVRARRQDVFDLLRARGRLSPAALDAVRRLQDDIACLHRTQTGGVSYAPRVDRSVDPQAFSDARRRAGARIDAALARAGPVSARLLAALCEPDVVLGRAADWRAVVERETGETLADAQGAILRMACENLAGAYGMTDRARGP
ncbi:MAG: hypothetical protein JWO83_521 [Caulobacteraceae bacterium]|nr:hypothetical protein [Caulobacteraceae bacterium]